MKKSFKILALFVVMALMAGPFAAFANANTPYSYTGAIFRATTGEVFVVEWDDYIDALMSQEGPLYDYLFRPGTPKRVLNLQIVGLRDNTNRHFTFDDYVDVLVSLAPTQRTPDTILTTIDDALKINDLTSFKKPVIINEQVALVPYVDVIGPTVSDISFGGVAQTIGTDNSITVVVNPLDVYNTASVTLSKKARVTVSNAAGTKTKTALVEAGVMDGAAAISAFTLASDSATGQKLIDEGTITVTIVAVDANDDDIPAETTVYTVNFVAAN